MAAEAFQNLDFESAPTLPGPAPTTRLPASQVMPGWTVYSIGGTCDVLCNWTALDSSAVSVHDGRGKVWGHDFVPLLGFYSIAIQDGWGPPNNPVAAWISQVGDVPANARSILYSSDFSVGSNLSVSLNGTSIPMSLYRTGPIVNSNFGPLETFIGDISAFAGMQDVELRFEKPVSGTPAYPFVHGMTTLDGIRFSTIIAPEPSATAMLSVGVLSVLAYLYRRRRTLH